MLPLKTLLGVKIIFFKTTQLLEANPLQHFLPTSFTPICFGPYLDVLHCALKRIDRLWYELQPVAGCGVERPHPGRLGVGCGRRALLLFRLIGKVVLILQHLHFQHLTHHVKACAARRREHSERGKGMCEDKAMVGGGEEEEINSGTKKHTTYHQDEFVSGWFFTQ